ncbi:MAG: PQQ-dependent sugar dehydrogenase, partial [Planctomycetes bacterium]|nr:PQQ-dependent sugar dehydrogenase [Planctomycetota bacterium]
MLTSIGGGGGGGGGASREPGDALAGLDVHADLDATLFASEPTIVSPTNLDIDHRGRIWICEVVNYRRNNGRRPEGDRIVILEDSDGDGVSDKSKVFYQGRDIDSAMGIVVLGNKVIVSCAPNVFVFHDDDGDDKADRKELLFSKTGTPQPDHSAHSIVFGPDGKFYWNFGNTGRHVHDAKGNIIVDIDGNEVRDNGKPYFGGMAFRCNADGSEFEVLGHNFRNNYEATVDSLGAVWQSDNDDDGNRGVRINYVMEFGNYGYRDEMTGAGWRSNRVGIEKEIPRRHWHLNDPGVVPNLLQTGAGSPTGITVYEGRLLPRIFWDQVIHCDAGPNVCRAYPVKKTGAGYSAESVDILKGSRDRWFRPADVSVAPDGSLFVTDWYDPGVGGHGMRDLGRGRIFRVAPPNTRYKVPTFDFKTAKGAVEALKNANYAARYLAWTALHDMGAKAEKALLGLYGSQNVRHRARALWLLGKIEGRGAHYVELAAGDKEEDIRVVAIRLARQLKQDIIPLVAKLASDTSAPVRRECAIALHREKSDKPPALWAQLAAAHDGKDRWYLEALGISAAKRWDEYFGAWLEKYSGKASSAAARNDVVWRSRASATPDQLASILGGKLEKSEVPRYLR